MSKESELIAALRDRLSGADTPFELSRCHFEALALLKKFPGSVEGRLLVEQIERKLRNAGNAPPPPEPPPRPSVIRSALKPLPWTLGLMVVVYFAYHFLHRYFK